MSGGSFRFLHAGDFHLEQPLHGVCELPDHLRDLFVEAPYLAAERVFEAALAEAVDFVLLSGDLLDCDLTGPRGPLFLIEQFQRLGQREIGVYWSGGGVDSPDAWPAELKLPENVVRFPLHRAEERMHLRQGQPLANIVGQSRGRRRRIAAADYRSSEPGLFSIALVHGAAEAEVFEQPRIHYWALGGRHAAASWNNNRRLAHYPGTPQGRTPGESGAHGCTLVRVDAAGDIESQTLITDLARWCPLRIELNEETTRPQLETLLREKLKSLIAREGGLDLLVSWRLSGHGPLWRQLRSGPLAGELLSLLRSEFGFASPSVWSVSLEAEPLTLAGDPRLEQETLLGDFLRSVQHLHHQTSEPLDLSPYVAQPQLADIPEDLARLDDAPHRRRVLAEAATLGLELLSGQEQSS